MDSYNIIKLIGDGTYGIVSMAIDKRSGDTVAIKRMKKKFYSWDECLELREIKSLRKLNHQNLIRLREVVREFDELNLIFEYAEKNLVQLVNESMEQFSEPMIRSIVSQILQGLSYIHSNGFFHRDLKPENILVSDQNQFKIADFGLAREIRSQPPYTDYVATRWYRAPELLLHSRRYSYQVDIFAVGCIMAELYIMRPLLPGSNEQDQICKLCSVLGTPDPNEWQEGHRLASQRNFSFPQYVTTPLSDLIPGASPAAIDFIMQTLQWDPASRPTADQCLQHPFFTQSTLLRPLSLQVGNPLERQRINASPNHQALATNTSNTRSGNLFQANDTQRGDRRNEGLRNIGASILPKPFGSVGMGRHKF